MIAGYNVAKGKVSEQQRYLSAFSAITCAGMIGYYFEFTAVSYNDEICALKLEYLYFCFAPVFLIRFIMLYTHLKYNEIAIRVFTAYQTFIYIIVLHLKYLPGVYYKSFSILNYHGTSYIRVVPGPLYNINNLANILWMTWLIFLTFTGYMQHRREQRTEFTWIVTGSVIPLIGWVTDISGVCGYYAPSILYNIIALVIFEYVVFYYNMFDPVEQAKDDFIHDMDEGVIVTNADNEEVFHNPAVEKIFRDVDWTDSEEIKSDVIGYLDQNHNGFMADDCYYNWRCNDLTNDGHCEGYIYSVIDVTEDYEYTKQLMALKDEALRAGQVKNIFIANISHEIRTPINSILGMNEMISREKITDSIRHYSDNIRESGHSLLALINDILDISKLEAGKLHIDQSDYDPSLMVYEAVKMSQSHVTDKHLGLKVSVSPEIPSRLLGDDIRIRQCISNLLSYSANLTEKGFIELNVSCELSAVKKHNAVLVISIRDTGYGIKADKLSHIFDSLEMMSAKSSSDVDNFSITMSMTKKITDMLGGTINIGSVYGHGSSYVLRVPQLVSDETPAGPYSVHIKKIQSERQNFVCGFAAPEASVLVIDDTDVNIIVARGLMKPYNMQVDSGSCGEDCLKMMQGRHYDIIFIDHMMPVMDGIETLGKIKSMDRKFTEGTRIIAMTGNTGSAAREFYLDQGFDDYITKPVEPEMLGEILFRNLPNDKIRKTDV